MIQLQGEVTAIGVRARRAADILTLVQNGFSEGMSRLTISFPAALANEIDPQLVYENALNATAILGRYPAGDRDLDNKLLQLREFGFAPGDVSWNFKCAATLASFALLVATAVCWGPLVVVPIVIGAQALALLSTIARIPQLRS